MMGDFMVMYFESSVLGVASEAGAAGALAAGAVATGAAAGADGKRGHGDICTYPCCWCMPRQYL